MSAIPDRCPFKAGDHIQLHGYPGYALPSHQRGYTGRVETYLGGTVIDGTTDDGRYWIEQWGALVPYGTPSDGRCTCCHRPVRARRPVQLALFELAGA